MALKQLGTGTGYLKAGFLGFAGAGKTYTATLLGIAAQKILGQDAPIAMWDTEQGSVYMAPVVKALTGKDLLGDRSRSFSALMQFTRDCESEGVGVAVIDSVTHPWREMCDSFLEQVNDKRKRDNKRPIGKLEFQHWGPIKGKWAEFTVWYLNTQRHAIICGRAGFEYDFEVNDEGRKELVKTGTKMKTETEFGFEPSLLVEMAREREDGEKKRNRRVATVLKDRFSVLDGSEFRFPSSSNHKKNLDAVLKAFEGHLALLNPGAHAGIDAETKTAMDVDSEGDDGWMREKRQREIFCEEIQGELMAVYPGQSAAEKKAKADLINELFGTRSWTKVENTRSDMLKEGLDKLRIRLTEMSESRPE
jgi:hypothetical protein